MFALGLLQLLLLQSTFSVYELGPRVVGVSILQILFGLALMCSDRAPGLESIGLQRWDAARWGIHKYESAKKKSSTQLPESHFFDRAWILDGIFDLGAIWGLRAWGLG